MSWQFTVYCGLYPLASIQDRLIEVFGSDEVYRDGSVSGETALFAFTMDAAGYPLEDSAVLSSCSWAIGRLGVLGGHQNWLDGFDVDQEAFTIAFNRLAPLKLADTRADTRHRVLSHTAQVAGDQLKHAVTEAVTAGAKTAGAALTVAATTAASVAVGPIFGSIAGVIAGKFAESLLTPRPSEKPKTEPSAQSQAPQKLKESGQSDQGTPIPGRELHRFVRQLAAGLQMEGPLDAAGIRVRCTAISRAKAERPADHDFLNSYIANDISLVEHAVRRGDLGAGLASYLTDNRDIALDRRADVRRLAPTMLAAVDPQHVPGGRWPADAAKPLVLSQQFAVNQIARELQSEGLFAVNGPPGTGKTTMLRDVIAHVVVQRARQLSTLAEPAAAFSGVLGRVAVTKDYTAAVHGLNPRLTGFEMVVATTSNTAAQNVTAEIPAFPRLASMPEPWRPITSLTWHRTYSKRTPGV